MNKKLMVKLLVLTLFFLPAVNAYSFGGSKKNRDKSEPAEKISETDTLSEDNTLVTEEAEEASLLDIMDSQLINEILSKETQVIPVESDSLVPDEIEYLYDQLLTSWALEQSARPECTGDKGTRVVSDSVIKIRLARLPHEIEMPYNNVVRSMIDVYIQKKTHQLEFMLGMSEYYFPIFEEQLAKNGLPLELKYLPVIESGLNPTAVSHMGAAGLWQFMVATGRAYGLEINSLVDERLDPIKSTIAATKYLKDLHGIYNDWNLAIAAYNCGPGNVNKAIKRANGERDFWKIYPYLPRETRGYVPIFIAANYAMEYAEDHNFCPSNVNMPVLTDTIMVQKHIHFEQIASVLNVPVEKIRTLNPQYRRDIIPGDNKTYSLCLPLENATAFIDKREDILAYKADELINNRRNEVQVHAASAPGGSGKLVYHKVKSGDTLGGIASR